MDRGSRGTPRRLMAGLLMLILLAWVGFAPAPTVVQAEPVTQATGTAKVRVIHSSFDAPAVDIEANGTRVLSNVAYRAVSDYLDVPAGNLALRVLPAGSSSAIVTTTIPVRAGAAYTFVASGPAASLAFRSFEDNLAAPAAGQAKVRFYRMSEVMAAVDYVFTPASGSEIVVPTTYPKTAGIYSELPAGQYTFTVFAAGTRTNPVISIPLDLQANTINAIVATGNPPEPALELQVVTTAPTGASISTGPARLRAIHSSYNAPAVDVSVNGNTVLRNVPFRAVSSYLDVPAGATRIQVSPTGTTTPVLDLTVPLRPGAAYTLVATDPVAEIKARLFEDTATPPPAGQSLVRFYRMSQVMATVDYVFTPTSGPEIVVPSTFPQTAGLYTALPAGNYTFTVYAAGTRTNPVITLPLSLSGGTVYDVVATGNPPEPALQLQQVPPAAAAPAPAAPAPTAPAQPAPAPAQLPATSTGAALPLLALALAGLASLVAGLRLMLRRR